MLTIVVCGSIGYGGISRIREVQSLLKREGFSVLDHISEKNMDYSGIKDFRNKRKLAQKIVKHDLEFIRKGDVIVAVSDGPSFGTAIEMFVAKQLGKPVILLSEKEIPTPWPIVFSDVVVDDFDKLVSRLSGLIERSLRNAAVP